METKEFLIINFDHRLTDEQVNQFSNLIHKKVRVEDIPFLVDIDRDVKELGYELTIHARHFTDGESEFGIIPPRLGILALFFMYYIVALGILPYPQWMWEQSDGSLFSDRMFKMPKMPVPMEENENKK